MNILRSKSRRNRKGTSAVEFAIAGPALLLIIFSSFEFARMSLIRNLAQDAAYEAARYSMVEGSTEAEAIEQANSILNLMGARGTEVVINDGAGITGGSTVKVHVSISMYENAFVIPLLYTGRYINAEMELRSERYDGFYNAADN